MSFLIFKDDEQELQIYNPLFTETQKEIFECIDNKPDKKPKIFCIDGNIGSGKSTILDELNRRGYIVFKEKVEEWLPYLTLFYKDPKRWMFTLQVKILTSMKAQHKEICKHVSQPYVFVERSPLSALLFIKNGIRNGYLTFEEIKLLNEIFSQNFWVPDKVFYVNTPVDVCFSRKCTRARTCEKSIETKYLQQLNTEYTNMYISDNKNFTYVQTVDGYRFGADIIDGTKDVCTITKYILEKCTY